MSAVARYFKRPPFRGDYQDVEPKWHIFIGEDPGKYGVYVGLCGYERSAILGDLTVSRAKQAPPRKATCQRCLKESANPEARSAEPKPKAVEPEPSAPVSETKNAELEWLVRELRVLTGFVTGTRNGELVPLADFMRERIAKAITMAADALEARR